MKPLIDGDVLRYEIGYAAEVGWRAVTGEPESIPPFDYVAKVLHQRIDNICNEVGATQEPVLYLSGKTNFRNDIATVKPYKGTRVSKKPWHFANLTAYMINVLGAVVCEGIEADDQIAMDHTASEGTTIVCSRDKDLRQLPGWFYSWELGKQPSFGPINIERQGTLSLSSDHKKLTGTGLAFFYAQCLIGDTVDNIPGCPGIGPVAAYNELAQHEGDTQAMLESVLSLYGKAYDYCDGGWFSGLGEEALLEQGRLLWLCRRRNEDGSPQMWEIGMEE